MTELQQAMDANQEIQKETELLFEELLRDLQQVGQQSFDTSNKESPNLDGSEHSGQAEKNKFQLAKRKWFLESYHSKYEDKLMRILSLRSAKLQESLKISQQKVHELQATKNQASNEIIGRVKMILISSKEKQRMLVQIVEQLNLGKDTKQKFEEWERQTAKYRKIYTKYLTLKTEFQPFLKQNVIDFLKEVDNQFEFGLQSQIQILRVNEKKAKEGEILQSLLAFLKDQTSSNADKINHLYKLGHFSKDVQNVSADLLRLVCINDADSIQKVYNKMVKQKVAQLKQNYNKEISNLQAQLNNAMSTSVKRFCQLESRYHNTLFKSEKQYTPVSVKNVEELDGFFKNQLSSFEGNLKDRITKYNNQRTFLKLKTTS